MRILLATGLEDLDREIRHSAEERDAETIEIVGECYYREAVVSLAHQREADTIVLSINLPGQADMVDLLRECRMADLRVVFLPGCRDDTKAIDLARKAVALGVYDLVWDPVSPAVVVDRVLNPATLAEAGVDPDEDAVEVPTAGEKGTKRKAGFLGGLFFRRGTFSKTALLMRDMPAITVKSTKQFPSNKVIAVVSPVPAGKTFIAVNLATALSQMGYTVALVDADTRQQSIAAWFAMDSVGLIEALKDDDPLSYAFQHPMLPELYVFSSDLHSDKVVPISVKSLANFLNILHEHVDVIVVDTYRDLNEPVTKTVIDMATSIVLVADLDFSHLIKLQVDIDKIEDTLDFDKFSLLVNRSIKGQNLKVSDAEKAVGLQTDVVLPEKSKDVLESIKTGIPAVLFCTEIKTALNLLIENLIRKGEYCNHNHALESIR
ncbi:MAG: hypothetical protein H0Z39_07100 [Peptococcaceae bacterium]|nr:hypothetical protein [Peptococcaceae bacterium]